MNAALAPDPSPEMIAAGETALIEYEYASRKYDDYSHKAAAEAVIAAALDAMRDGAK